MVGTVGNTLVAFREPGIHVDSCFSERHGGRSLLGSAANVFLRPVV